MNGCIPRCTSIPVCCRIACSRICDGFHCFHIGKPRINQFCIRNRCFCLCCRFCCGCCNGCDWQHCQTAYGCQQKNRYFFSFHGSHLIKNVSFHYSRFQFYCQSCCIDFLQGACYNDSTLNFLIQD